MNNARHLFPLDEFCAQAGRPAPHTEFIPGDEVPEPYRSLLVHRHDMTPTLEQFYGSDIHLEILSREQWGEAYFRQVVLRLNGSELPVEFGANKISLELFSAALRDLILEERVPLGHLLRVHHIHHTNHPQAFLRVHPDEFICRALGLAEAPVLYGRRNTLRDPQGRPLSEIVEILPPAGVIKSSQGGGLGVGADAATARG